MPKYGFSITKRQEWRGAQEPFANTYYFDFPTALSPATAQSVLARLVALEKAVHAEVVTFVSGRCWSAGGTPTENETIVIVDFSGTGTANNANTLIGGEATYLVQWRTSRPSETGRPVTLKKWIRSGRSLGSDTLSQLNNTAQISAPARAALTTYANSLMPLVTEGAPNGTLTAPSSGRTAQEVRIFPWIEHHELEY